jgi:hypothetical protein
MLSPNSAMLVRSTFVLLVVLAASFGVLAQGGKADPKRIEITPGKLKVLSASLSNGQEMEYVFSAVKGQRVTITNSTKNLFDFKVFNEEHFSEGDFDSSVMYSFEIPETADYLFYVRKKQVKSPRTAKFSIRLSIK